MGISHQQIQKKDINLSKYQNSRNIVVEREFKDKNRDNPSFKDIYLILFFYENISIPKLIDSILNKFKASTV